MTSKVMPIENSDEQNSRIIEIQTGAGSVESVMDETGAGNGLISVGQD